MTTFWSHLVALSVHYLNTPRNLINLLIDKTFSGRQDSKSQDFQSIIPKIINQPDSAIHYFCQTRRRLHPDPQRPDDAERTDGNLNSCPVGHRMEETGGRFILWPGFGRKPGLLGHRMNQMVLWFILWPRHIKDFVN